MTTTGYSLATSPITVDGVSLVKSEPPACQVNFHMDVVGSGHVLESSHSVDKQNINIYLTHIAPEHLTDRKRHRLGESVDVGVLEPGYYVVSFYLRGDAAEGSEFHPSKSVVLRAQGKDDAQLPPDHSHDWHAWVNAMPPGPSVLHVTGTVSVPDGNQIVTLVRAVPQGFNPRILILDLAMHDASASTAHDTEVKVYYSEQAGADSFDGVHIRFPNGGNIFIDNIIVAY